MGFGHQGRFGSSILDGLHCKSADELNQVVGLAWLGLHVLLYSVKRIFTVCFVVADETLLEWIAAQLPVGHMKVEL
jgi:hypothetical protein